ncbi:hypothetical protein P6U16_01910 [Rhizobium sp. 32-5/1]|nr:hypothetical protein [Rhizobium sp. 32-5/1]WEZ83610.1 hypothetical protein P6U16_01910 [Rhizobium sp. 32-5/1]
MHLVYSVEPAEQALDEGGRVAKNWAIPIPTKAMDDATSENVVPALV